MECCCARDKETEMPQPRHNNRVIEVEETLNDRWFRRTTTRLNQASVASWLLLSLFLFTQPWMANWANNNWWNYNAGVMVYADDGSKMESGHINTWYSGTCSKPAHELKCTNGEDAAELAWKYRGAPVVCGPGQGFYGEALCPSTWYGFTVGGYVCPAPSLAAMFGLSVCPILGSVIYTIMINAKLEPSTSKKWPFRIHSYTSLLFMLAFLMWCIFNECVSPYLHSVMTVLTVGASAVHWVITAYICSNAGKPWELEVQVTKIVAVLATTVMVIGAILLSNGNSGYWAHSFWFAEAMVWSLTFGMHPFCVIGHHWRGDNPFMIGRSTH